MQFIKSALNLSEMENTNRIDDQPTIYFKSVSFVYFLILSTGQQWGNVGSGLPVC